jgi:plasmid maintenance system killer protein
MFKIKNIKEENIEIQKFLIKRRLLAQYKKSKQKILNWFFSWVDLKIREPKNNWIYSFRINKQFRAYWRFLGNELIVSEINNHQN